MFSVGLPPLTGLGNTGLELFMGSRKHQRNDESAHLTVQYGLKLFKPMNNVVPLIGTVTTCLCGLEQITHLTYLD